MKTLTVTGVLLASALLVGTQAQAGVKDYSRGAINQGMEIHEALEQHDSMWQTDDRMELQDSTTIPGRFDYNYK